MEKKIEEFKKFVLEQLIDYDDFREASPKGYVDDITDMAVKLFAIPVVIDWVACADTYPKPSEKPKYLADTGNEVIQCGFSEKDAGIWPNVKQWCNVPKPPCL